MYMQQLLPAFTPAEYERAHRLLATRVAFMMGRKFEEGDWADVYCQARGIERRGWSNLNIDIINGSQGIEHKMLCYPKQEILSACGCTLMHPSATRSIRLPSLESDPDEAMRDILTQYADFLRQRRQKVLQGVPGQREADMRTGWLLWQPSLRAFLYFEERTQTPDPDQYFAKWYSNPAKGMRKASKNLWIFEKDTGKKRFSVTTAAGAKIQPYFDVPAWGTPGLYHFVTIGEQVAADTVRIWVTEQTYRSLCTLLGGGPDQQTLSQAVLTAAAELRDDHFAAASDYEKGRALCLSAKAYGALQAVLPGVNDDHSMQLLIRYLAQRGEGLA